MGMGFGHPDLPDDVESGSGSGDYGYDYEPEVSTEGYPRICCEGQDCCDEGLTYIPWMTTEEPICCVPNTMVEVLDHDCCCLEEENSYCCPDLENHCQNAQENPYCCPPGEEWCPREQDCRPAEYCCPTGQDNCEVLDGICTDCCCPVGETCCPFDATADNANGCIADTLECCVAPDQRCEFDGSCDEHCCID